MGAYATVPLTRHQYKTIIEAMRTGSCYFKPNIRISEVLIAEANLGIRIEDVLALKPSSFVFAGGIYKISIIEQKTKKKRYKSISHEFYKHLSLYIKENEIKKNDLIFPMTERSVQKYLKKVCDFLEYENISTHSFRKYCGMNLYEASGYNIIKVMNFYQHSSPAITQRYLGVSSYEEDQMLLGYSDIV
jgi:integrase